MSSSTLATIQTELNLYGYPLIMILGNLGNISIIFIFSRQRRNACSIYVLSLAVINDLYLTFNCLTRMLSYDFTAQTIPAFVYCKTRYYISGTLGQVAKTMIVLASIDRYMITSARVRFRTFSTPKRAKDLIFFSFIFWLIAGCHIPIMVSINNGQCSVFGIYGTIFSSYVIICIGLLPPILSGIFGWLTYRNLRHRHMRVHPIGCRMNEMNSDVRRRDRYLLILVISEVFLYVITTSLYPAILSEIMISRYIIPNKSVQYLQIEGLISTIAFLLAYINHGASFYVYLISSKTFRRDCKQFMIDFYRKLNRQARVSPSDRVVQTVRCFRQ